MTIAYTPTTVSSGYNPTQINANFTAIQTALTRAIDRGVADGANAMNQDLDLGTNDIINVGSIAVTTELTVGGVGIAASVTAAAASAASAASSASAASDSEIAAASSETNAGASATLASQWASLTGALVAATDYSSKEYAIGTFIRGSIGSAKDWATLTSTTVDGSEVSAREWARGVVNVGLTNGGSARMWATYTSGTADDTEYSAKEYAVGTTVPAGSAKQWATEAEDVLVNATEYSAFHWAQKAQAIVGTANVAVSANDTTMDYLINKVTGTHGLGWTEINDGGNEDLQIGITGALRITAGTAAAPAISFQSDSDTGIYSDAANTIRWSAGGVNYVSTNTSGLLSMTTRSYYLRHTGISAANPTYTFNGDINTGMYSDTGDVLGFSTAGTARVKIGTGLYTQNATGGDQGADTINASGLFVDGNAVGSVLVHSSTDWSTGDPSLNLATVFSDNPQFSNFKVVLRLRGTSTTRDRVACYVSIDGSTKYTTGTAIKTVLHNVAVDDAIHDYTSLVDDYVLCNDHDYGGAGYTLRGEYVLELNFYDVDSTVTGVNKHITGKSVHSYGPTADTSIASSDINAISTLTTDDFTGIIIEHDGGIHDMFYSIQVYGFSQ